MDNWKVNNETAVFDTPVSNPGTSINTNNSTPSKKKLFLLIGGGVLALVLIFLAVFFFVLPRKTDLIVLVAPEIAEIEIDGKLYKNGNYKIPVGTHTVSISADGFSYTNYDITVNSGEAFTLYDYLDEETGRYSDKDYDILALIASDEATVEKVNSYRRKMTIFNYLPFLDDEKKIYLTDQRYNSACENSAPCLGLTNLSGSNEEEAEESAFSIIRSAGYDPNDYSLLYETTEQNYYKETN